MNNETKKPKISVLMPVYNTKEEYLREAVESILNQTFTDFEFIIINDGSTNNAKDVILSYTDNRIKYYEQENIKLIGTLNRGLSLCTGEYIARMDSDDISLPERFAKQVEILDNNPDIGIVSCWFKCFPDEYICQNKERPKYLDLLKSNQLAHPAVMFRKEIFDKYDLKYENYLHAEDYELWSRLIKYTDFYNIQEILLNYRVHPGSISCESKQIQIETDKKVKENMLNFLTDDKELQDKIRELLFGRKKQKTHYNFFERIFSVKNSFESNIKHKIITILGIKIKIKV